MNSGPFRHCHDGASPKRAPAPRSEWRAILPPEYLHLGVVIMKYRIECATSTRVSDPVKRKEKKKKYLY